MSGPPGHNRPITNPAQPASSCFRCYREGIVSTDQIKSKGGGIRLTDIRFHCICGHDWTTNRRDAEQHGRFLQRLNLNRSTDV